MKKENRKIDEVQEPRDVPAAGEQPGNTEQNNQAEQEPEATQTLEATHEPETTEAETAEAEESADMERRLAEAEQRGYLRGRNESIEALMQPPAGFAETLSGMTDTAGNTGEPLILNNLRLSIWERGM